MFQKTLTLTALALGLSACASQVVNPVGNEFRTAYGIEDVRVALTDPEGVPDRYDEAVTEFYGEEMTAEDKAGFDAFREASGDTSEGSIGEQYLVYRIDTLMQPEVARDYRGERPAIVTMDVTGTTFPNAATMMLVGEIKNITYDLKMVDGVDGDTLVETPKKVGVAGDRSAGGGGGLLGMALRSGKNQMVNDLDTLAANAADSAITFLTGETVSSAVVKRVMAYPDRIETGAPAAATPPVTLGEDEMPEGAEDAGVAEGV